MIYLYQYQALHAKVPSGPQKGPHNQVLAQAIAVSRRCS